MSDRKTITVASNAHTAIRIHSIDPAADPEKPGAAGEPAHVIVIHGNRHADAAGGVGLTHGVDAETFDQWMAAHPEHQGIMTPMSEADVAAHLDPLKHYGYEPGLKAAAEDPEQAKLAAAGSNPAPAAPAPAPVPAPAASGAAVPPPAAEA
jgi:hypothetical protein